MLRKIDEKGRSYLLEKVPYEKNFEAWLEKISDSDFRELESFLTEEILGQDKFSIGVLFPQSRWDDTPLAILWQAIKDKESTGLLLGRIVLKILIEDKDNEWKCTSTNLQGRDFETNFYWK